MDGPPFTPRVPITPDYLEEGEEELQLTERDVRRMVSGCKACRRVHHGIHNLFKPQPHLIYNNVAQDVFYVLWDRHAITRRHFLDDCIPVHYPASHKLPMVKVAFIRKADVKQLHAAGCIAGERFSKLLSKLQMQQQWYSNMQRTGSLSLQVCYVNKEE